MVYNVDIDANVRNISDISNVFLVITCQCIYA